MRRRSLNREISFLCLSQSLFFSFLFLPFLLFIFLFFLPIFYADIVFFIGEYTILSGLVFKSYLCSCYYYSCDSYIINKTTMNLIDHKTDHKSGYIWPFIGVFKVFHLISSIYRFLTKICHK